MEHSLEDVKTGDKVFHCTIVMMGWNSYPSWEVVTVTKVTKTLVIVGDSRFVKKYSFGVDLFKITGDLQRKAKRDNAVVQSLRIASDLRHYRWEEVSLEKLLKIQSILIEESVE